MPLTPASIATPHVSPIELPGTYAVSGCMGSTRTGDFGLTERSSMTDEKRGTMTSRKQQDHVRATTPSYSDARAHYLSPKRRDPVKILMEEVVSHQIFADAVQRLALPDSQPLRVLDLGCGVGDGLNLLTQTHGKLTPIVAGRTLKYVGLDAEPNMIEIAADVHPTDGATFLVGDMRDPLPDGDFDLYLSCGVPYSHLTFDEVGAVITGIIRRIVHQRRRAAIIVDVLGQFSIEWNPNWHSRRWNYAMTFFEDTHDEIEPLMTFFDRSSLSEVIETAALQAGKQPTEVGFTDRSILVGRHTATRSFNPSIPPYRTLINDLARGLWTESPEDLYFDPPNSNAPSTVLDFFGSLAKGWNDVLDHALAGRTEPHVVSNSQAMTLARTLLRCETQAQRGLGVGHSLTATVIVDCS